MCFILTLALESINPIFIYSATTRKLMWNWNFSEVRNVFKSLSHKSVPVKWTSGPVSVDSGYACIMSRIVPVETHIFQRLLNLSISWQRKACKGSDFVEKSCNGLNNEFVPYLILSLSLFKSVSRCELTTVAYVSCCAAFCSFLHYL